MSIPNGVRFGSRWMVPLALAMSAASAAHGGVGCETEWSDIFGLSGDTVQMYDTTVWDDGTGPALYAVGNFRQIGNSAFHVFSTTSNPLPSNSPQFIAKWNAAGERWETVGGPTVPGDVLTGFQRLSCIATFDPDGPSGAQPELLVVGGRNTTTGSGVAVWNGSTWSTLGTGLPGSRAQEVAALASYDADGEGPNPPQLYAGGNFRATTATGSNARYAIARWDGSSWLEVAGSLKKTGTPTCTSLAVYNGELYVGGDFTQVGQPTNINVPGFAKWNGTAWSAVPGITTFSTAQFVSNTPVMLKTLDMGAGPALLVSGVRYTGLSSNVALAQLKDGAWSTLLERGFVYAATMFDGALHIGGNVLGPASAWSETEVDLNVDQGATKLFRKTATGWDNIGFVGKYGDTVFASGMVRALSATDWDGTGPEGQKLFVGGQFAHVDDKLHWNMFLFDGQEIEPVVTSDDTLGFLGSYTNSGGANGATIFCVKELDIDGGGLQPTTLVIGGEFESAGLERANRIVAFNGSDYTQIGENLAAWGSLSVGVRDALYFNDGANSRLFVCKPDGIFSLEPVSNLWQFSAGSDTVGGSRLLQFPVDGQNRVVSFGSGVRWFNGSTWESLNHGIPAGGLNVMDAVIWDDGTGPTMYAAVHLAQPTPEMWSSSCLVRWNTTTSQWDVWGDTTVDNVAFDAPEQAYIDLAVYNGSLYAAGTFDSVNDVAGTAIVARRSGTTWAPAIGAFSPGTDGVIKVGSGPVSSSVPDFIAWHDFGAGPELVVRGKFSDSSGTLGGAGRWNGTAWTLIPGITEVTDSGYPAGSIYSIASGKPYDGLYFTGLSGVYRTDPALVIAGSGLARLNTTCPTPTCPADFNNDGARDVADLFAYINAWLAKTSNADFNDSGNVDVADLFAYINAWLAGC